MVRRALSSSMEARKGCGPAHQDLSVPTRQQGRWDLLFAGGGLRDKALIGALGSRSGGSLSQGALGAWGPWHEHSLPCPSPPALILYRTKFSSAHLPICSL